MESDKTYCAANTSKDESRFKYQLEDQKIRDNCIDNIRIAKKVTDAKGVMKPFFVGCGFHKPHVPWIVPHEFYESYPDWQDIPLAKDVYAPVGMPKVAWHPPADVAGFHIGFNGTCNATLSKIYRRAYYGAITYQDYNIGMVLDELDRLELTQTTAVINFGDHGWQLGEHATWAKMTNFELGVHIPLLIRAPWKTASIGQKTDVLAEAVDFYPTLAALAGLPDPRTVKGAEGINGTSLEPVFDSPTGGSKVKQTAFSQFAKSKPMSIWPTPKRNETNIMGYSVRVDEWRYTAWFGFDKVRIVPNTSDVLGTELYDHRGDTGLYLDWAGENVNVVNDTANKDVATELHQRVLDYIQLQPIS
jgi:arylsulfatase A-like enzyme